MTLPSSRLPWGMPGSRAACSRASGKSFRLRLPEFDLGAVGIDDPGETATRVAGVVALQNRDTMSLQPRDDGVEIVHRKVHHELALRRRHIVRGRGERG